MRLKILLSDWQIIHQQVESYGANAVGKKPIAIRVEMEDGKEIVFEPVKEQPK